MWQLHGPPIPEWLLRSLKGAALTFTATHLPKKSSLASGYVEKLLLGVQVFVCVEVLVRSKTRLYCAGSLQKPP